MQIEIVGEIDDIAVIATGSAVRRAGYLRKHYGAHRWRKLKGFAYVQLSSGRVRRAELHWYEAHGVGKKGLKIKRFVD